MPASQYTCALEVVLEQRIDRPDRLAVEHAGFRQEPVAVAGREFKRELIDDAARAGGCEREHVSNRRSERADFSATSRGRTTRLDTSLIQPMLIQPVLIQPT